MRQFLSEYCGLSGSGCCQCERRLCYAMKQHRLDPSHLEYLTLQQLDESLLEEYLENKQKLSELKEKKNYMNYRGYDTSDIDAEINNIEANILEFVSNLNTHQLKSIIYMSLDMDVKIGHPDKLMADKL